MKTHRRKVHIERILIFLLFLILPFFLRAEVISLPIGLRMALKEENLIKIKKSEQRLSMYESLMVRSGLLPHIDFSYGKIIFEHEMKARNILLGRPVEVPTAERDFYTYSITLRQLIFDFLGVSSLYESSKIAVDIKRMEVERTKNLISLQFINSYFDLLETEKMIEATKKEVESFESHLKDAMSLFEEGLITKNELLQAELRLSDAKQRLIRVSNMRKIIASNINKMIGRDPMEDLKVEEVKREVASLGDLRDYFKEAEERRIELRIMEKIKKELDLVRKAKKAEYFPKIFLEGKYGYTKNKYQVYEGMWSFLLGINVNIFDGGKREAEIKKIDAEKTKALLEEKKIIDEIRLEVEKYYLDFFNAEERIRVSKAAIRQAEENLRINRLRFREGVGTGTDVVDAISLYHLAQTNYYKAFYDLLRAEIGLFYALGKNLEEVYGG